MQFLMGQKLIVKRKYIYCDMMTIFADDLSLASLFLYLDSLQLLYLQK